MTSNDRSSILAALTEYRFKKTQIFTFEILVKPQDKTLNNRSKTLHKRYIYENCILLLLFFETHDF